MTSFGDINGDGIISGADVVYLASHFITSISNEFPIEDSYIYNTYNINGEDISLITILSHYIASIPKYDLSEVSITQDPVADYAIDGSLNESTNQFTYTIQNIGSKDGTGLFFDDQTWDYTCILEVTETLSEAQAITNIGESIGISAETQFVYNKDGVNKIYYPIKRVDLSSSTFSNSLMSIDNTGSNNIYNILNISPDSPDWSNLIINKPPLKISDSITATINLNQNIFKGGKTYMIIADYLAVINGLTGFTNEIIETHDSPSNNILTWLMPTEQGITFVQGLVPNWMQPKYYETVTTQPPPGPVPGDITRPIGYFEGLNYETYNNSSFLAWCSPTAAACQLGHLNQYYVQPVAYPSDNANAGDDIPIALKTIVWNTVSGPGWCDYLLDGHNVPRPTIGDTTYSGPADFGYFMDTNNVGINGAPGEINGAPGEINGAPGGSTGGSTVGTKIINIYNGLVKFYQTATPAIPNIGMCYNKSPYTLTGQVPAGLTSSSVAALQTDMLNIIKNEIDNNRTVLICLKYWNIASLSGVIPISSNNESEIEYYNILNSITNNPLTGESYPWNENYEENTAVGHTVLVVGYINKETPFDIAGNTDWLIVRDNQENTHRNVVVPYNKPSVSTVWDILLATIFVNPVISQPQTTIYVDGGTDIASPFYNFYSDSAGTNQLLDPQVLDVNTIYTFKRLNNATTHPFYISDVGYEGGATSDITLTGSGNAETGITGTEKMVLSFNSGFTTEDTLEYYCTHHSNMINAFSVIGEQINYSGSNIDGYLVDSSGEVFNFLAMHNSAKNIFDTSGVTPLKTFTTDSSYGRFDISLNNPPPVTLFKLTGGQDIFTDRPNKNTFERILLTHEATGLNYIPITPITTLVACAFSKLCEIDISKNGIAPEDLSVNMLLEKARTHIKHMLGPDFSGVNIAYIEKDPYDEIYKALDTSNIVALQLAKRLVIANLRINIIINGLADSHDPNNFNPDKDKKYRRKIFKHFCRRMHKKFIDNGKDINESLDDNDNDNESIENDAATDTGTSRRGTNGDGRRTNKRFYRKLQYYFKNRQQLLDSVVLATGGNLLDETSVKIFLEGIVRLNMSLDNVITNGQGHKNTDNDIDNSINVAYADVASNPPNRPNYRRNWQ